MTLRAAIPRAAITWARAAAAAVGAAARGSLRGDDGRVTAFVVVAVTGLLLVAGLVMDGGEALAARSRAIGIAEEAARAACQQIDLAAVRAGRPIALDDTAAETAAQAYLAAAGATGTVTTAATPTGPEVTVSATVRAEPRLLTAIGIRAFDVTGVGAARPSPPL